MSSFSNRFVLAIIPARSGSKGVKDKNLAQIEGKTLLEWSIAAAKNSGKIDSILVSTDSSEYAKIAEKAGAEVPFLRPAEISSDKSTDYEFINHAINELRKNNKRPELIVHLRPTSPFRDPIIIDKAIEKFEEIKESHTSLRSIHEMSESAYKTFEVDENNILMSLCSNSYEIDNSNSARQKFPKTYNPNGYVDILSTNYIEKNGEIHGNRVYGFITAKILEVDSQEDLELLRYYSKLNKDIFNRVFGALHEQF